MLFETNLNKKINCILIFNRFQNVHKCFFDTHSTCLLFNKGKAINKIVLSHHFLTTAPRPLPLSVDKRLFKSFLALCCKHACSIDKAERLSKRTSSLLTKWHLFVRLSLESRSFKEAFSHFYLNEHVISGLSRITATLSTYKHSELHLWSDNCVQCILPDLRAILEGWAIHEAVWATLTFHVQDEKTDVMLRWS